MRKNAIAVVILALLVASACLVNASTYEKVNTYMSQTIMNKPNYYVNQLSNVDSSADKGTHSNFTAQQYGPDSIYDTLTEVNTGSYGGAYGGVSTVTATGSIPNDMASNVVGVMGIVFFNPTNDVYTVTTVDFNAMGASQQVFNGISQGSGLSYPTTGWTNDGSRKYVYWTGTINVQPHTSQQFYVNIKGNNQACSFTIVVEIYANSTTYSNFYTCEQLNTKAPWSVLLLGNGTTPTLTVTAPSSTSTIFNVSLAESGNQRTRGRELAIDSGGKLTILVPPEFTNIVSVGGTGWGAATVTGNKIQVSNTQTVLNDYITYSFNATTPSNPGLYMLNVSFNGTPYTQTPIGNFSIQVTYSPINYELDLEEQWINVDYHEANEFLCVYLGSHVGSEPLRVDVWYNSAWQNLLTDLSVGWNNVTVSSYLAASTFTIRFKGGLETGDTVQDNWNIDATLLHVWS